MTDKEWTEVLANRVWEYASMDYDNEGSIEDAEEQIENEPNRVIEYLLDLLDHYVL